jgi:hypothetical protein
MALDYGPFSEEHLVTTHQAKKKKKEKEKEVISYNSI